MKYLTWVLLFVSLSCYADIYMQNDSNGNAVYSDTPLSSSAKKINLPAPAKTGNAAATMTSTPVNSKVSSAVSQPVTSETRIPYTTFVITSPVDQETIQNQPSISVKLKVEPQLQEGDFIQVYLDGKPAGEKNTMTLVDLPLVERGTHQISAALVDSSGQILKQTTAITIYVHRAALGGASNIPRPAGANAQ